MADLNRWYDRALDLAGMVFLNRESLDKSQSRASPRRLLVAMLVLSGVLALPTDLASVAPERLAGNFATVFAGLALLLFAVLVLARVLGSREPWHRLLLGATLAYLAVQLFFLPVSFLLTLAFDVVLRDATAVPLALSLIPFYLFAAFGWACEASSRLRGWRGVALACLAIALAFGYNLALAGLVA
jgi:hypothetical protein